MHLLVREVRELDEGAPAVDLGQPPADLLVLSFSDSDLGALAHAWDRRDDREATLRLANLGRLLHPMSVDLYAEQTVAGSRCVLVRLLGGLEYWRYGAEELAATCRREGIPLVLLPGDGGEDARLAALSTAPPDMVARLDGFLRHGGPDNLSSALRLLLHLAGRRADDGALPAPMPPAGVYRSVPAAGRPRATILFYRSHLMAGDVAAVDALDAALSARGLAPEALFVSSLKEPPAAGFVTQRLREEPPAVLLNATFFSARREEGGGSPLDAADVPVLQLLQPGSAEAAWAGSRRGLSQGDLAMQVVLPELDGRLLTTAISFKEQADTEGVQHASNMPFAEGIALAADRAKGWVRLRQAAPAGRRVAILLSDYPGLGGQVAHAVGLDGFASLEAILGALAAAGYATGQTLEREELVAGLCQAPPSPVLPVAQYRRLFETLPAPLRDAVTEAWGEPEADPAVRDGCFTLRHLRLGHLLVAVQPERGARLDRKSGYHDPDTPPRHGYLATYLWLREAERVHALLHLGTHGTLEWLPGRAAALSGDCAPAALLRGLPVIYPFIVNNPGEAAAAKRRLGAVTIGHLTPPMRVAGSHGAALELERLIDDYAAADGLDRRRGRMLRTEILARAEATGLLAESGVRRGGEDALDDEEALARLDAYLCDVKDLMIRDGLHVFGRPPGARAELLAALAGTSGLPGPVIEARLDESPAAEMRSLLAALDGRMVPPGPAGAPTRGRADVLPTGRNLFTADPRAVPTRAAIVLAEKAAAALLERHRQEQGDWLRRLVIDLWGSASLRTGGESFGLALLLMGVRPVWDEGSNRVRGVEIIPLAALDRPRVDVTLRISGVFRDNFPQQIALFDQAVRAVAERDEGEEWNGLAEARRKGRDLGRIFGAAPGQYGAGTEEHLARGLWQDRAELGRLYLAASAHSYGREGSGAADPAAFADQVAAAQALLHVQDHAETDLLDSPDVAAHEGGFAAAAALLGAEPALYHGDSTRPDAPRIRSVAEEVARVVRGRAANPRWIAGMMRHGYRGAGEIARAADALCAFAATLPDRFDAQFELLFEATLGNAEVEAFLSAANPDARAAMAARFEEARRAGLWRTGRNDLGSRPG